MLDIRFVRENPDIVKQNLKNKYQEQKLPLVDEVIALDAENRRTIQEANDLRAEKNRCSKQIGVLMAHGQRAEAEEMKKKVAESAARLAELEKLSEAQRERIEKAREEKADDKKLPYNKETPNSVKRVTIEADSEEDFIAKLQAINWKNVGESYSGDKFDFSV